MLTLSSPTQGSGPYFLDQPKPNFFFCLKKHGVGRLVGKRDKEKYGFLSLQMSKEISLGLDKICPIFLSISLLSNKAAELASLNGQTENFFFCLMARDGRLLVEGE